jgi:hypothetical protein
MNRKSESTILDSINRQAATAMVAAMLTYLHANNISKKLILSSIRRTYDLQLPKISVKPFRKLVRAYEDMGIIMSTWFSAKKYLDKEFRPIPLSTGSGSRSISNLVRTSRVAVSTKVAIELMRRSPSVKIDASGCLVAQRREFVLPDFAVLRAAVVVERYLDTLQRNSSPSKRKGVLLLERNCHVPEVDLKTIAPILRDIKRRGSAYIDSVNGDIEVLRLKRSRRKGAGEMSVHIFAWTRLSKARNTKRTSRMHSNRT